jgi:hypothetical protein|nr:hypothetical protein [Rhodoferax sp.]
MLAYFLVAGLAFGLAYWITGTGPALWRAIVGALLGLIIGWVGGTAIVALLLYAADFGFNSFDNAIGRSFGWALLGSGYGVYRARKKLKATNTSLSNAPQRVTVVKTTTNDAYAKALAEIEENRIDKGTWARCYALSDGDESKAKAAYIKARAGVLGAAPTWANTQPNSLDGAGVDIASTASNTDGGSQTSTNPFPKWLVQSAIGLAVFGVLLAIALPAYQDYSKRAAVAAKGSPANSQIEPSAANKSFTYEEATGQQATQPAERGPWEQYQVPPPEKQIAAPQLTPFTGTLDKFDPSTARPVDTEKAHFERIDAAHPDAESIVISSDFNSWVAKNPSYRPIVAKGTSQEVIDMLTRYKNER